MDRQTHPREARHTGSAAAVEHAKPTGPLDAFTDELKHVDPAAEFGLKKLGTELEKFIRENDVMDLESSTVPAILEDAQAMINRLAVPDLAKYSAIPSPELRQRVKEAAGWEILFNLGRHQTLDSIVTALEHVNYTLADKKVFTSTSRNVEGTEVKADESTTEVAGNVEKIATLRAQGKKVLERSLAAIPENYDLQGTVRKLVGPENIITA